MAILGFADSVGLSGAKAYEEKKASSPSALSPRRAVQTVREILESPQFRDGVRLFAIGAAVSASKVIFDATLNIVKRLFVGQALFRGRDEAYRWILLLMVSQPSFRRSPRSVEVSARPTLLLDLGADHRGEINEEEARALWKDLQDTDGGTEGANEKASDNQASSSSSVGAHFFPATNESVPFIFEGVRFWARRTRELVGDETWEESIELSYLSFSTRPLRRIVRYAQQLYKEQARGRVTVYRVDRYSNWCEAAGISKRSVESVHLKKDIKEKLLEDAKHFLDPHTRRWYSDRGIPYRRGYLFYGTPGSGKSSLCHVLASELQRPIYSINLGAESLTDEGLTERMGQVPAGAIVLMEDIDAAFVDRSAVDEESKQRGGKGKGGQRAGKKGGGGVSFSALLNSIDGIGAAEGRLCVLTTNYRDHLDSALIRPGRVDLQFEFRHATAEQAKDLFLHWYTPRDDVDQRESIDVVRRLADQFAEQIVPDVVSVAALQGYLLTCGPDCRRAVADVGKWMQEQRDTNM